MTRSIDDNPSGWSRSLPGHTVELDPGFALPWNQLFSQVIAAGSYADFTINFTDPFFIYFVDIISISPQASRELAGLVYVNGVNYVAAAGNGWLNIPLRQNPSVNFINGESLKIRAYNLDSSNWTFIITVNGTKIARPANFGRPPGAYFTFTPNPVEIDESVSFTDGSTGSPTSWEWYFEPDVLGSTVQNPTYQYLTPGNKYPILKSINRYGWDSYGLSSPLVVCPGVRAETFTEYDPISKISPEGCQSSINGVNNNETAYIYRDYGMSYFVNVELTFRLRIHNYITTNSECVAVAIGNSVGDCRSAAGYRYVVLVSKYAGVLTIQFRLHNGSSYVGSTDPNIGVSVDTFYWCRVVRLPGQTYGTLYVYTDEAMTSLLGSITTTPTAGGDTQFRYLYLPSSYNFGYGSRSSGCTVYGLKVVSH